MDDKDSVVIDIKNPSKAEKYFCSYCNSKLFASEREDELGSFVLSATYPIGQSSNQ